MKVTMALLRFRVVMARISGNGSFLFLIAHCLVFDLPFFYPRLLLLLIGFALLYSEHPSPGRRLKTKQISVSIDLTAAEPFAEGGTFLSMIPLLPPDLELLLAVCSKRNGV